MVLNLVLVLVGLAVLAKGADTFVLGAVRLAVVLRVAPVVVGAVVVGFGTGVPELLVSSLAASRGELGLAAGNVIGSNLANVTLVLGVTGLIARIDVLPRVVRRDAPLSLAAVVLFALVVQDGLTRSEGAVLLGALAVSVVVMLRTAEPSQEDTGDSQEASLVDDLVDEIEVFAADEGEPPDAAGAVASHDVLRVLLGLVATVAGAQVLVIGAQKIATDLGLTGGFVGLTLVAVGTSLPELVTGIQSARRGETALLVGNVLGSNVFNCTAVGGAAALIGPGRIQDAGLTSVAAISMVCVAALAWLFLGLGGRLKRGEAAALLGIYGVTVLLVR